MSMHFVTESPEETEAIARAIAARLRGGDCLGLDGPLGSGKTCFVRGLASGLGLSASDVSSPTFVIARQYAGDSIVLDHLDAYRLGSVDELQEVGWDEMVSVSDRIVVVEWAEKIEEALPESCLRIAFDHAGATTRDLWVRVPKSMRDRLAGLDAKPRSCPTCGETAKGWVETFPFCSGRCRMADLGEWFAETHRIVRPLEARDLDEE